MRTELETQLVQNNEFINEQKKYLPRDFDFGVAELFVDEVCNNLTTERTYLYNDVFDHSDIDCMDDAILALDLWTQIQLIKRFPYLPNNRISIIPDIYFDNEEGGLRFTHTIGLTKNGERGDIFTYKADVLVNNAEDYPRAVDAFLDGLNDTQKSLLENADQD